MESKTIKNKNETEIYSCFYMNVFGDIFNKLIILTARLAMALHVSVKTISSSCDDNLGRTSSAPHT